MPAGDHAPSARERNRPGDIESSLSYAGALRAAGVALGQRDYDNALEAVNRAILLAPDIVAGYEFRGLLWRILGDYVKAAADYATCLALDPRHNDREAIEAAARRLTDYFRRDPVVDEGWVPASCHTEELRSALDRRAAEAAARRRAIERPACSLPCPSICCYFDDETFAFGVQLTPGELDALRPFLAAAHLREEEYLGRLARERAPASVGREWFVSDADGQEYLYHPRRGQTTPPRLLPTLRPRSVHFRDLAWLTANARGCAFLSEAGCAVHDVGDPPGLTACRSFLCLTALVFVALRHLGAVGEGDVAGRRMEDLNRATIPALDQLDACLCSGPELLASMTAMREALAAAREADAGRHLGAVQAAIGRYESLRNGASRNIERQLRAIGEFVRTTVDGRDVVPAAESDRGGER